MPFDPFWVLCGFLGVVVGFGSIWASSREGSEPIVHISRRVTIPGLVITLVLVGIFVLTSNLVMRLPPESLSSTLWGILAFFGFLSFYLVPFYGGGTIATILVTLWYDGPRIKREFKRHRKR